MVALLEQTFFLQWSSDDTHAMTLVCPTARHGAVIAGSSKLNLQAQAEIIREGMPRNSVSKLGCQEEFGCARIRKKTKGQNAEPSKYQGSFSTNQFAFYLTTKGEEKFVILGKY